MPVSVPFPVGMEAMANTMTEMSNAQAIRLGFSQSKKDNE